MAILAVTRINEARSVLPIELFLSTGFVGLESEVYGSGLCESTLDALIMRYSAKVWLIDREAYTQVRSSRTSSHARIEERVPSAWSQEGVCLCLQGVPFFGGRGAVEADDMIPQ